MWSSTFYFEVTLHQILAELFPFESFCKLFAEYCLEVIVVVVVRIFNATRHQRHIEAAAIVVYMYLYILVSWITHAHLVPLSVTKCRPVHFILNPGHVEYELDVLVV